MASNKEKLDRRLPYDYSKVIEHNEIWRKRIACWRYYPYKLARIMQSQKPLFGLALIQDVLLLILANFDNVHITGTRGIGKTYIALLEEKLEAILRPYMRQGHTAPTKEQATNIVRGVNFDIDANFPLLAQEFQPCKDSKDELIIRGRSSDLTEIRTYAPLPTVRGGNITQMKVEESGQEGDKSNTFNHKIYQDALLPAVRTPRMINMHKDICVKNKIAYLTNASSKQNDNYRVYLKNAWRDMVNLKGGFVVIMDWRVAVLSNIRDFEWAMKLKDTMSPDAWLKNMESIYIGSVENPILRDEWITRSRSLPLMELQHCGKKGVNYSIGYDVSQEEGAVNAKCAIVVNKFYESVGKDKYSIDTVYIEKREPSDSKEQAKYLKEIYNRFCPPKDLVESGEAGETFIAIDTQSYGKAVLEDLMRDLGDGYPPFTTVSIGDKARKYSDKELQGAIPCVYPIKARTGFNDDSDQFDPDSVMIDYVTRKMAYNWIRLPISPIEGVKQYKQAHKIKEDYQDAIIAEMYQTIDEMIGQIQNLKKRFNGSRYSEQRVSIRIQRDLWSAFKYSCRIIQLKESELTDEVPEDEWSKAYSGKSYERPILKEDNPYGISQEALGRLHTSRLIGRRNGKI